MTVHMERRFFRVNSAGDNEFEWLLKELGVPEDQRAEIDEVEFEVDPDSVDWGQQ